jgi:hypothetical protein
MHVAAPMGCVAGHVPQAQVAPLPPAPPWQVQSVVPYVQGPRAAQAPPPVWQVPVGCMAGHEGQVVQVHTGFVPPPQSHTTLPYVHMP